MGRIFHGAFRLRFVLIYYLPFYQSVAHKARRRGRGPTSARNPASGAHPIISRMRREKSHVQITHVQRAKRAQFTPVGIRARDQARIRPGPPELGERGWCRFDTDKGRICVELILKIADAPILIDTWGAETFCADDETALVSSVRNRASPSARSQGRGLHGAKAQKGCPRRPS